jgi:hypothetical protein
MTARFLTYIQLLLLVLMAILLIPAGAHLFELPGKMALSPGDYMTVQGIYAGWALFGLPIFLAMAVLALHAYLVRRDRLAMWLSLLAVVCIALTQVIFWSFTQPMNALSENWTVMPADLETARRQWEYSHAINAGITFAGFVLGCLAVLAARRQPSATPHR